MLQALKEQTLKANLELVDRGLVLYTFGNASAFDRASGLVVIKPSGVDYKELRPEHMVVTDLAGNTVEGDLRPSSDLHTHLELYKAFPQISGVVHTHSENATAWAQAGRSIPALGTTHADYFMAWKRSSVRSRSGPPNHLNKLDGSFWEHSRFRGSNPGPIRF